MNPFFTALSAAYIFGIFYCADSSSISVIGELNPFSILHVPLYGVLTLLLLLAFASRAEKNLKARYALAVFTAVVVGILDEYQQSFIPIREGSWGDFFLDLCGVFLVLLLAFRFPPSRWVRSLKRFKI
jgi:VanZ family protein